MSGIEFLKSVDKVFDNAAKIINLSEDIANLIKFPNSTYKLNFGVRINNKINRDILVKKLREGSLSL